MPIDRLILTDFRNHADTQIRPGGARLVVLTGDNGAGKTNILEAVSLLAPGRGLRGVALRDMARQGGSGGFAIAAEIDGQRLGTGTAASAPDRRQVRINESAAAATALADHLAISWLTPVMDRLFQDGASGRRRFLDRLTLALHPEHGTHSNRYEAAMRARNALLAEDRPPDPEWLTALEAQMDRHGTAITRARSETVDLLNEALARQPEEPFARPLVGIEDGGERHGSLADALRAGRGRDRAAGRTLSGPHRSDMTVLHTGKRQPAALCSTGEQKALLLSLILAHAAGVDAARPRPLVMLLDEVAAHLDATRRGALFERLRVLGGQIWMTGTESALFDGLGDAARFTVSEGCLTAC